MEYISLILTIIFGVPTIISYLKSRRTTLLYLEEKQINLQEDLLENFNSLKITYDNIEINNKISYVKGSIVCYGSKDLVDKNNKIEISANDSKWLNFKINNISKGLEINVENKNNKIILSFELLKNGEFFEFEALIERTENDKNKLINLDFFHRIANIPNVKKIDRAFLKNSNKGIYNSLILIAIPILMLFFINKLRDYNLTPFDSTTNKEVKYLDTFSSKSYKMAEADAIKNYYGIELMFSKTKNYNVTYTNFKGLIKTNQKVQIYFKKDSNLLDYFPLMFFLIFIIIGITKLYNNIIAFNQKKIMRYIDVNS